MSLQQKVKDFGLLVQRDKKWQLGTAAVAIFLVMTFVYDSPKKRRRRPQDNQELGAGAMGKQEAYQDLINAFKASLDEVKVETAQNREQNVELQENLASMEERTSQIFKKILERMEADAAKQGAGNTPPPVQVGGEGDDQFDSNPDVLATFGPLDKPLVAPPPRSKIKPIAFVGAGDSVRVKLLSGVDAPTDGTPYPVVFKLTDDIDGPDGSRLPLGEARLIAAAQGSLTDQRALFRLHTLNIRFPNGQRKVLDVDGWIVGEDGLRGMEGFLIDPLGKAIIAQGINGAVGGLGQAISASNVTTSVDQNGNAFTNLDGDTASFMAGRALKGASDEWSDTIKDRVDDMVPHVRVYSGRQGTAVFAKSVSIKGLYEMLEDEQDVFAGLD